MFLFFAGRVVVRTFGAQSELSGGTRLYATCKAPWQSAWIAAPGQRFTLWVMTGAPASRRPEGVAELGGLCQAKARRRLVLAVILLGGGAVLAWLARPERMRQ